MNHGILVGSKPWSAMTRLPQHLASSLGYQVPVTCVEPRPLDLRSVAMRLRWSAETAARGARTKCIQISLTFFGILWQSLALMDSCLTQLRHWDAMLSPRVGSIAFL